MVPSSPRSSLSSPISVSVVSTQNVDAAMTKLATLAAAVLLASAGGTSAFSPPSASTPHAAAVRPRPSSASSTSLNLFGSKPKDPSSPDGKAQPGMMDQLAMFKKAQEIAQKKAALDKELAEEKMSGTAADGKVEIEIKYVPPQGPTNPTPTYEASGVNIDAEYLEATSAEDLSAALVDAIRDGERIAMERVGEKYKSLEEDLKGIMGGMAGGAAGAPPAEAA
ncbi:hypothetical protein ACHAWF_013520 [Thalassiosira exigua]